MFVTVMAAILIAQAATPLIAAESGKETDSVSDVAYSELTAGENREAIERIEANENLAQDDPARLINLGIAHARLGDEANARAFFRAAVNSEQRLELETATGEWRDSRVLAKTALRKLDRGEFSQRFATSQ